MQQIIQIFGRCFWFILKPLVRLYWRFRRPLTVGVRALVRDGEGRVLLVRHSYIPGWYMPGGGVERGETARHALRRELDEEAGIMLNDESPRLIGLYANFREFKSDHVALYLVEAHQYQRVARTSFEISEHGFFALDALPDEISPATRARLTEIAQGLPAPDMW
ncbi:MAG: NUDIX domain-containing protein [Parvibaculum sp.]|nr:NUDIX domain-containing protein [Parvibaculum sp.]